MVLCLTGSAGVVAACSSYDDGDSEIPPPDASTSDVITSQPDAAPEATTPADSGSADAADAAPVSTCASNAACDCDGDGFPRIDCDAGASSTKLDCDDNDRDTHPGQGFLERVPATPTGGDWDCSTKIEKAIPENLSCAGTNCIDRTGFVGTVGCGELGTMGKCVNGGAGLFCVVAAQPNQVRQLCK